MSAGKLMEAHPVAANVILHRASRWHLLLLQLHEARSDQLIDVKALIEMVHQPAYYNFNSRSAFSE